jgi:hypothetical protein
MRKKITKKVEPQRVRFTKEEADAAVDKAQAVFSRSDAIVLAREVEAGRAAPEQLAVAIEKSMPTWPAATDEDRDLTSEICQLAKRVVHLAQEKRLQPLADRVRKQDKPELPRHKLSDEELAASGDKALSQTDLLALAAKVKAGKEDPDRLLVALERSAPRWPCDTSDQREQAANVRAYVEQIAAERKREKG